MRVCKLALGMMAVAWITVGGAMVGAGLGLALWNLGDGSGWFGGYILAGGGIMGGFTLTVGMITIVVLPPKDPWDMVTLWERGREGKPEPIGEI